jgi:Predicted transcriptional regulator
MTASSPGLRMPDGTLPADRILLALKARGPLSTAELARLLGVTGEAARQQLLRLEAEGLIEGRRESGSGGVGRPRQSWSLTGLAQQRFPDTHPELTVQLIRTIEQTLGAPALDRVIDARQEGQRQVYLGALRERARCVNGWIAWPPSARRRDTWRPCGRRATAGS